MSLADELDQPKSKPGVKQERTQSLLDSGSEENTALNEVHDTIKETGVKVNSSMISTMARQLVENLVPLTIVNIQQLDRKIEPQEKSRVANNGQEESPPYVKDPTTLTREELETISTSLPISAELRQKLKDLMQSIEKEQIDTQKNITQLINQTGKAPKDVLIKAMENSQFIGLGDVHPPDMVHIKMQIEAMKDLHDKGKATHLVIELPTVLQPVFDKFNNDPRKGELEIPDKMVGADGKENTSEDAKLGLMFLKALKEQVPDLFKLWTAGRDAGTKIACVDNIWGAMNHFDPGNPQVAGLATSRETDIKNNVMGIYDSRKPGEPEPKLLASLGAFHFANSLSKEKHKSAGELIRTELAKKGQKMTTFFPQTGGIGSSRTSLFFITPQLNRPVSVATHDKEGKENSLAKLKVFRSPPVDAPDHSFAAFDHVLIYPPAAGGEPAKLLPAPAEKLDLGGGIRQRMGGGRLSGGMPVERFNPKIDRIDPQAVPRTETLEAVIKIMPTMKPLPASRRPEKYLQEVAPEKEVEIIGNNEIVFAAKKDINTHGQTPESVLTAAMQNNRVLGIEIDSNRADHQIAEHAAFSLNVMQNLKKAGATHLIVPVEKRILEKFMADREVDRAQMPVDVNHDQVALYMQAAIQNGLKLVSSGSRLESDYDMPQKEIEAVKSVLQDKNAKAILISQFGRLANVGYKNGKSSVAQLIRRLGDPSNPQAKVKLATMLLMDAKRNDNGLVHTDGRVVMQDINIDSIAILPEKTSAFKNLKVQGTLDILSGQKKTLGSWDIILAYPSGEF